MAKLKMKYLEIVAPLEQSKEIVDMLQLRSVIELHSHEEQEGLTSLESGRTAAQLTKYRDCAQTALDIQPLLSLKEGAGRVVYPRASRDDRIRVSRQIRSG